VITFAELAASRREWIETVLKPWCKQARWADLKRAELEWADIAGRVDPKATLWTWAWGRFPHLVHEGLTGVNETHEVCVRLKDGAEHFGYPDNRRTDGGRLALLSTQTDGRRQFVESPLFSIDDIADIRRL
jgi:hypothetical protein